MRCAGDQESIRHFDHHRFALRPRRRRELGGGGRNRFFGPPPPLTAQNCFQRVVCIHICKGVGATRQRDVPRSKATSAWNFRFGKRTRFVVDLVDVCMYDCVFGVWCSSAAMTAVVRTWKIGATTRRRHVAASGVCHMCLVLCTVHDTSVQTTSSWPVSFANTAPFVYSHTPASI